jgi:signal transduction histidine kinase
MGQDGSVNDLQVALAERYAEALRSYLSGADESGLWRAYELGRESLESGVRLLDLLFVHRDALDRNFEDPLTPAQVVRLVDAEGAVDFLLEALAPYEMAQRVWQEEADDVPRRAELARKAGARQKRALGRAMQSVERLEEERRRLAADLVDAEEKERNRIAAEVHDDSLQVLSALDMRLQSIARGEGDQERRRALEAVQQIVRLASERLRNLVFDLRPPELERVGLSAVLRASLERLSAESGIEVELLDELETPPPPDGGIVIYRITQEALANVRKHARASRAVVTLAQEDGGCLVQIRDDGQGFDPAESAGQGSKHFGLTVMRERAETVGGWIRVESLPGEGTVVEAWVPGASKGRDDQHSPPWSAPGPASRSGRPPAPQPPSRQPGRPADAAGPGAPPLRSNR